MPAAAACDESVRVTVATLAFAVELDNDGFGACSGKSLPTFFDGMGSFWFVSEMIGAFRRLPYSISAYSFPSCPIDGNDTLGGRCGASKSESDVY